MTTRSIASLGLILSLWSTSPTGQREVSVRVALPAGLLPAEVKPADQHVIAIERAGSRPRPDQDKVVVLDARGQPRFNRAPGLDVPKADMVAVDDADLLGNQLVVSVFARSAQQEEALLLLSYDLRTGRLTRIVQTNPIACRKIALESSGGLWCLGLDVDRFDRRQPFRLLHHFNADGVRNAELLERSLLPKQPNPWLPTGQDVARIDCTSSGACYAWFAASQWLAQWSESGENLTAVPTPAQQVAALGDGHRSYSVTVTKSATPGEPDSNQLHLTNEVGARALGRSVRLVGVDNGQPVFWDRVSRTVWWSDTWRR